MNRHLKSFLKRKRKHKGADSPSYFKMLEMFKKHMINPRKTQEIKMNKLAGVIND